MPHRCCRSSGCSVNRFYRTAVPQADGTVVPRSDCRESTATMDADHDTVIVRLLAVSCRPRELSTGIGESTNVRRDDPARATAVILAGVEHRLSNVCGCRTDSVIRASGGGIPYTPHS